MNRVDYEENVSIIKKDYNVNDYVICYVCPESKYDDSLGFKFPDLSNLNITYKYTFDKENNVHVIIIQNEEFEEKFMVAKKDMDFITYKYDFK